MVAASAARVESRRMKILVAVDGSKASLDAVRNVIDHAGEYRAPPAIELVTVHRAVPRIGGAKLGKSQLERYYREEGEQALAEAKKLLDRAGVPYQAQVLVGEPAEVIVEHAGKTGCDLIVVGAKGRGALGDMLLGSTATKLLHLSDMPVLLVK
jgi:nucleotide-binding universal stress UspA family protein